MAVTVISGPTVEPVDLEALKNAIKVDSDLTLDDVLIAGLGIAARRFAELFQRRAYITQTLELTLDRWPAGDVLKIPRAPLQSITSIKYYDSDGESTMDSGDYFVDTATEPGRVVLNAGSSWPVTDLRPANGVIVRFVAGYGDQPDTVPETIRNAIALLVGHWYENRGAVSTSGAVPKELPFGVESLLWLDRVDVF